MKHSRLARAGRGRRGRAWLTVSALGVVAGGCGESGGTTALIVADSAGIQIVTNVAGSIESVPAWSIATAPALEIGGGTSPEVPLFRVTAVAPLGDGRVAVGMSTPPQGFVFASDGALAARLGRRGEGPGEFTGVGSVFPIGGDSIAVWDPERRRVSVFGFDGTYAREVDLSHIAPPSTIGAGGSDIASGLVHLLRTASGSLVVFGEGVVEPNAAPGVGRARLPAHRIAMDGRELASYGRFPGMTVFSPGLLPLPLGARTYAATSGDELFVGTAESAEIRVFGPGGDLTRIVRWPDGDRAVGGPFLARWFQMLDARPEFAGFVEPLPRPERFPAYEGVLSADTGEILVGEYAGPLGVWPTRRAVPGPEGFGPMIRMPERRWLVFDPAGGLVATVTTPEGFEPYAVRDGSMWGVYTDVVDVESIRAYELTK